MYDASDVERWATEYAQYRANLTCFIHWNDSRRRRRTGRGGAGTATVLRLPSEVVRKVAAMTRPTAEQFQRVALIDTYLRLGHPAWQKWSHGVRERCNSSNTTAVATAETTTISAGGAPASAPAAGATAGTCATSGGRGGGGGGAAGAATPTSREAVWVQEFALCMMQEQLQGGTLSPYLHHFRELVSLQLWGDALAGPVPACLGRLANLEVLCLNHNCLTGPLPPALFDGPGLRFLAQLQLQENALTGGIPEGVGTLVHLEHLNLGGNRLSGQIPASLGRLVGLRYLDLSVNQLTGPVPASFANLARLETCALDDNRLCGPLPPCGDQLLLRLRALRRLDLRGNGPLQDDDSVALAIHAAVRECFKVGRKIVVKFGAKRPPPETGNFIHVARPDQLGPPRLPPPPPPR